MIATSSLRSRQGQLFRRGVCDVRMLGKARVLWVCVILTFLSSPASSLAQCGVGWLSELSNNGAPSLPSAVLATAVRANGERFVGGAGMLLRQNGLVFTNVPRNMTGTINAMTIAPNGDLIVAGTFTLFAFSDSGTIVARNIARWNGQAWSSFGETIDAIPPVSFLVSLPNGDIVAATGTTIHRWNGATWSLVGTVSGGSIFAMAVLPNGEVIIGGSFLGVNQTSVSRIARLAGGTWSTLGSFDAAVLTLSVSASGDLYAGGEFTVPAGSNTAFYVARWNGSAWVNLTFLPAFPAFGGVSAVVAVAASSTGDVYVATRAVIEGPNFTPCWRFYRNNVTGNWVDVGGGNGFNGAPKVFSMGPDGVLFIGGSFTTRADQPERFGARYSTIAAPFIVSEPQDLVNQRRGDEVMFSSLATYVLGADVLSYQWRKNGLAISTVSNPTARSPVLRIVNAQPSLHLGFYDCLVSSTSGCVVNSRVAALSFRPCGASDVAGPNQRVGFDTFLTADDIIVFLRWFFAGDVRANVAGPNLSTIPDNQLTADDVLLFLQRYFTDACDL